MCTSGDMLYPYPYWGYKSHKPSVTLPSSSKNWLLTRITKKAYLKVPMPKFHLTSNQSVSWGWGKGSGEEGSGATTPLKPK